MIHLTVSEWIGVAASNPPLRDRINRHLAQVPNALRPMSNITSYCASERDFLSICHTLHAVPAAVKEDDVVLFLVPNQRMGEHMMDFFRQHFPYKHMSIRAGEITLINGMRLDFRTDKHTFDGERCAQILIVDMETY